MTNQRQGFRTDRPFHVYFCLYGVLAIVRSILHDCENFADLGFQLYYIASPLLYCLSSDTRYGYDNQHHPAQSPPPRTAQERASGAE